MGEDAATYQEMSVHDKDNATLAPTERAQDMSHLNRVTVPMPAFVNPHQPIMAAGSVNLSIDETPVPHADDFGAYTGDHHQTSTMDAEAGERDDEIEEPEDDENEEPESQQASAKTAKAIEYPEDKSTWTKKHWQGKAREFGLHVSGTVDEITERVEEYETGIEEAKSYRASDWITEIEGAETEEDLAEIKGLYDRSGASFSTVVDAFEKRNTELSEQ